MPEEHSVSLSLYEHYSSCFAGMSNEDGVSLGSAFRILHEVSENLARLDLLADSMPVEGWQEAIKLNDLKSEGYDLKFEIWMAFGPVGQLAKLIDECKYLSPDTCGASTQEESLDYSILPDSQCLLKDKTITSQWMQLLRRLRERCLALDVELQKMATNCVDIRSLLFHGYLIAMLLHQVFSMLEFAELVNSG